VAVRYRNHDDRADHRKRHAVGTYKDALAISVAEIATRNQSQNLDSPTGSTVEKTLGRGISEGPNNVQRPGIGGVALSSLLYQQREEVRCNTLWILASV